MRKNKWKNLINKLAELIKYGFAGAISTFINLLFFWLLEKLEMYYILANILSYLAAITLNYSLNKCFVFKKQIEKEQKKEAFLRFLLIRVANLLVDNLLFYFAVSILHFPLYVSRVTLTMVEIVITYGLVRKIVFGQEKM